MQNKYKSIKLYRNCLKNLESNKFDVLAVVGELASENKQDLCTILVFGLRKFLCGKEHQLIIKIKECGDASSKTICD